MNESVSWIERINCGIGGHEVEFTASPWGGVCVSFNPCSMLPQQLRKGLKHSCQSSTLELGRSQDFQGKWFGLVLEDDPWIIPEEIMNRIDFWQCNQIAIARKVLSKCPIVQSKGIRKVEVMPAIWAKLVLMLQDELEVDGDWLLAHEASCKQNYWLSCLMTACCLKRRNSLAVACRMLEHQTASLHPTLRFNFELQIAMQGTRDSLQFMLKLLASNPQDSFRANSTKTCLREMHKEIGFEKTIQAIFNGLIEANLVGINYGGLWFSLFHSLNFCHPKLLLDLLAIDSPRAAVESLACLMFSEQYLLRYRGALLPEINRRDLPYLKSIASSLAS